MSDNQWIRLSGDAARGRGLNMAHAERVYLEGEKVIVEWASGKATVHSNEEAKKLLLWLRDQHLPALRA